MARDMYAMNARLPALVLQASELFGVLALLRNQAVATRKGPRLVEQKGKTELIVGDSSLAAY